MSERIRVADGVDGELSTPAGDARVPGIVVLHEQWGMTDDVRRLCDRFASEGFLALAPDLYHGERPSDEAEAMRLMQRLATGEAMLDVRAAKERLAADPRCNGMVAITGFCMGGALTFAAAASLDGFLAAVPFCGMPRAAYFDGAKTRCPIQAHFAQNDPWVEPTAAAKLAEDVNARGGEMELHVYDAGHAFMRESDPAVFHPECATEAWSRTVEYLRQKLA